MAFFNLSDAHTNPWGATRHNVGVKDIVIPAALASALESIDLGTIGGMAALAATSLIEQKVSNETKCKIA